MDDYRLVDLKWVFRPILRRKIVFSTEDFAVGVCYITKMGVLFDPSKKFVCSAADFAVRGLLHHHHESEKIISIQTRGLCSRCLSEILMNKFEEITYDLHPYEVGCQHYKAFRAAHLFRAIKISIF